ncbi:MAG: biotin/lipoyl-containing protein [Chloroflexota bacterium]|nr:biotin/lipoyl-containing protein [Chloroflexota bacterium]MQG37475.1 biotin/lipoyl-binding protein [SAR202 cluster bacterium]
MASKNYKINIAGKTYDVEVGDISKSPVEVSVDGTVYQVEIPESVGGRASGEQPTLAPKPLAAAAVSRPSIPDSLDDGVVRSPMPGRILSVNISVGDTVTKGQPIFILESMKMENTIASSIDGKVTSVHVAVSDSVQHGQTLAEIAKG